MSELFIDLELREGVTRRFTELVLDYTGTLSLDGLLLPGTAERLANLARSIRVTVLTADTFGKAQGQLEGLPVAVHIVVTGKDKADFVRGLGPQRVIAVGNGRNDVPMMTLAGLRIAVIGPEGAATELLHLADIVVTDIRHALELITNPLRLKATMRN